MKATFFGHQSWMFQSAESAILLDPLLMESFGFSDESVCAVYPFREVDLSLLPALTGVFLSHEHPDHVCLDTLRALPKYVPIYVGPLALQSTRLAASLSGHEVIEFKPQIPIQLGTLTVTPFHADRSTPAWERLVYQFLIEEPQVAKSNSSIFVAVDAGMSKAFEDGVKQGEYPNPNAVVVSNNSQIRTDLARTAFENANFPYIENANRRGVVHLTVLDSLANDFLSGLEMVQNIIVCGGGFIKGQLDHGLAEQDYFGHIYKGCPEGWTKLGLIVPSPGDELNLDGSDRIHTGGRSSAVRSKKLLSKPQGQTRLDLKRDQVRPFLWPLPEKISDEELQRIKQELQEMVDALSVSSLGRETLKKLDSEALRTDLTIVLLLSERPEDRLTLTYDLKCASDPRTSNPNQDFSMMLYASDLLAVFDGEIEFWDLTGAHVECRFYSEDHTSLVAFLYTFWGEQVRQDPAICLLKRRVGALGSVSDQNGEIK